MQGRYNYKVPDGKLLKVAVKFEGSVVKKLKITGDFFLYPETGLELIEKSVKNKELGELQGVIEQVLKENKIDPFGFKVRDLVFAIKRAMEGVEK